MSNINHIVFYGTLKRGKNTPVHKEINTKLQFRGECTIPGKLHDLGRLTALKPGSGSIRGELYKILNDSILQTLDEYESVDNESPSLPAFSRKSVNLLNPKLKAWAYYYDGPV